MLLVVLILALAALVLWRTAPPRRLRRMGNKIPGPRSYPLVGNIPNCYFIGTKAIQTWNKWLKKYGNTFRFWIGPDLHIFITEPEDIQMILSSQTLLTKSTVYNVLHPWMGTGLLLSTGDLWHRRRKAITPTFHFKILEDFLPTFNKCARTLVSCLKDRAGKGPFNPMEYFSNCALDAITETAMETEMKAQTDPVAEYPKAISRLTKSFSKKVSNPFLGMEPVYTWSGRKKLESDNLKTLFSLPLKMMEKKKHGRKPSIITPSGENGNRKKTAFLDLLLQMKSDNEPSFENEQDVIDEVVTFMFEGHDTSAIALSYTIWLLGQHPEIQEQLYNEVSSVLDGKDPSQEDYHEMAYLERILKESFRMYPPVPIIARLATEDIVLPASGYTVPKGAQLDLFLLPLHWREDLFPDPARFDPDRFLAKQRPFSYLPFSAGPRNCIGQKFAMLDLKVIISNIVLNFHIHSSGELVLNPEMVLRPAKGLDISLTLRS